MPAAGTPASAHQLGVCPADRPGTDHRNRYPVHTPTSPAARIQPEQHIRYNGIQFQFWQNLLEPNSRA
jgi:hypothetical protein